MKNANPFESLFRDYLNITFLVKSSSVRGSRIVTLPGQELKYKRKAPDELPGGLIVDPARDFQNTFRRLAREAPEGQVFVTTTLKVVDRGIRVDLVCRDLTRIEDCPEDIREEYRSLKKSTPEGGGEVSSSVEQVAGEP